MRNLQISLIIIGLTLHFAVTFNTIDQLAKMYGIMGDQLITYTDVMYQKIDEWADHVIEHAKGEECYHHCTNGKSAVHNLKGEFRPNGCKTFGLVIKEKDLLVKEMSECCNHHQICYHKCGSDKNECDKQFINCLSEKCKVTQTDQIQLKGCERSSKLLLMGVLSFGCKTFKEHQKESCLCVRNDEL